MNESAAGTVADGPVPRRAGFWLRGLAFALDLVSALIALYFIGGIISLAVVGGPPQEAVFQASDRDIETYVFQFFTAIGFSVLIGLGLCPLIAAVFDSSPLRATPGKLTTRIYVVDTYGRRLRFWRALGREYAKLLSAASLLLGFALAGLTREKTALHDLIAGSRVYRLPPRDAAPSRASDTAVAPVSESAGVDTTAMRPPAINKLAYVFAGLGALPGLGWPFGIAAIIWGLITRKANGRRVAAIAAICTFGLALIYGLMFLLMMSMTKNSEKWIGSMLAQQAQLHLVRTACHIELFHSRHGRFPKDLEELYLANGDLDTWLQPHSTAYGCPPKTSPNPLNYNTDGRNYVLFDNGLDGVPGTKDDVQLPENWQCPEFHPASHDTAAERNEASRSCQAGREG